MSETVIFVPGLNCTRDLFEPQIAALSSKRPIQVADHRHDASLGAIAERLLAASSERFALAGLSMGGYIALEVMRRAPERVTRLALLDTSARPDTSEARANRERMIDLAGSGRFEEVCDLLWSRLVHPDRQSDRDLERRVQTMARDTGPDVFVQQQRAIIARPDSRPSLAEVEVPTLVLVGADDVITPKEVAREMAELIRGADYVEIPHCGHLSTMERPDEVTGFLERWLAA